MSRFYGTNPTVFVTRSISDPEEILTARRRKLKDPNATPEFLDDCAHSLDFYMLCQVAKHHNTSEETMETLIATGKSKLAILMAQNPVTSREILDRLVFATKNIYVWRNVANHKNTSGGTLAVLAHSDDNITVFGVARNANTMVDTLVKLTEHENAQIRAKAFERLREMRKQNEKITLRRTCF